MYRKRSILPKILLFAGFLALFLFFKYQEPLKEHWLGALQALRIHFDNFSGASDFGPKRQPPISFLEKETDLKLYIGEPFRDFTQKDWDEFWNLIYGTFPEEQPQAAGMPRRMRQLTSDEIAFKLMELYPQPFAFFKESHWKMFFGIALKKR